MSREQYAQMIGLRFNYMANKIETIKYNTLHWWIRRKFGSANKCSNPLCEKKSPFFEWALLKEREYSRDIKDYQQLCRKCHFNYDVKENQKLKFNEGRKKAHVSRIGMKHTKEAKLKMSASLKGRETWNKGKAWSDEAKLKRNIGQFNVWLFVL